MFEQHKITDDEGHAHNMSIANMRADVTQLQLLSFNRLQFGLDGILSAINLIFSDKNKNQQQYRLTECYYPHVSNTFSLAAMFFEHPKP